MSDLLTRERQRKGKCLVAGQWVSGNDWLSVDNPATGALIGQVPSLGRKAVRTAIDGAAQAMPLWAAKTAGERAQILQRAARMMEDRKEALAAILTEEQGKPLAEARGEITYAASFFQWFGEEAKRAYGEIVPGHLPGKRILILNQPVGVVGAITPWNFPAAMVTRKLAPALAAGCGIVLKPSELTPFTAIEIVTILVEAGVPKELVSVITGDAVKIGAELLENPTVRKISFTGSTATGRYLMEQAAPTIKKLSLELGGNAPFIVFDDADVDAAVEGAIMSKYRNAGQTCVCANRFYVQSGIYDAFVDKFAAAVARLRIGNGAEPDVEIGPLIDERAVAKVERHIADALEHGAKLVLGGGREAGSRFFAPTVIRDAAPDMLIFQEETFGPVAAIMRFETDEEAVALANNSEFGLAAYFYARDMSRIWKTAEAIEVGMVGVNTGMISTEVAPFGGIKQSGIGREGSRHGLNEYQELKYVCLSLS